MASVPNSSWISRNRWPLNATRAKLRRKYAFFGSGVNAEKVTTVIFCMLILPKNSRFANIRKSGTVPMEMLAILGIFSRRKIKTLIAEAVKEWEVS